MRKFAVLAATEALAGAALAAPPIAASAVGTMPGRLERFKASSPPLSADGRATKQAPR